MINYTEEKMQVKNTSTMLAIKPTNKEATNNVMEDYGNYKYKKAVEEQTFNNWVRRNATYTKNSTIMPGLLKDEKLDN